MKNTKQFKTLMILCASSLLIGCSGGDGSTFSIPSTAPYGMAGLKAKSNYEALIGSSVSSLNYLNTQEQADAQHFANFVDGLLLHNEFGVLEKNLATKAEVNETCTQFDFDVRTNVPWVRYDGTQYTAVVNGVETPQYVKPADFVTTAKAICTFSNGSTLTYLVANFIAGAAEYYAETKIAYNIKAVGKTWKVYATDMEARAQKIMDIVKEEYETAYNAANYDANPITGDDIPAIQNGSRFGVVATDTHLTYKLYTPASYFPTLLTYSPYLPTNEYFYNDVKFTHFGEDKDKILYCGPYLLADYDENQITYVKNKTYWAADSNYILDKIHYIVAPSSIDASYTRTQFESGVIDGFGLSSLDEEGWSKYITGPDGTGTYEEPYSGDVNARFLDTIGSMYGTNISMERANPDNPKYVEGAKAGSSATNVSYASLSAKFPAGTGSANSKACMQNTMRALRLEDVRRAIIESMDYEVYNERYGEGIYQTQYMTNTYTPKGFCQDDDGNDYVEGHYYKEYAKQKGITNEEAATILAPGQYEYRQRTAAEVKAYADKAEAAINAWNATASEEEKIVTPVYVEYYSVWDIDADSKQYDSAAITSMNCRLNGMEDMDEKQLKDWLFYVIPTDSMTSSNYETVSRAGSFDFSPVLWGWGADYGDPLSFMNTYCKHGDWKDIFGYIDMDYVPSYKNDNGTLVESDLLAAYTAKVKEGAAQYFDFNARFDRFAEAEYMLIEDLAIYKPQVNYGQGWSFSISKALAYMKPTASYGLSDERMTGMYVLKDKIKARCTDGSDCGVTRASIREKYDAAKAAYLAEHGTVNIY